MKITLTKIKHFLNVGIWQKDEANVPRPLMLLLNCIRKLYLSIIFFIERGHFSYAPALAFSTMLAIVPVVAVVFAVARGFGLDDYITQWMHSALESQPQAADTIIGFAQSYLAHARSGVIIGVGLVFMLYSVLSLIYSVETVFNDIWQVKEKRSPARMVIDYTALLFLVPVGIIVVSGLNIFIYTVAERLQAYILLGTAMKIFLKLLTFVLMSGVFTALYVFMPNTKVRFSMAVVPGIIAGTAMLLLQSFYIYCQIFLTSYNAIYGSFAALPLFMLWILVSWYICLFCAELSYMSQNMDHYAFLVKTEDVCHERQMAMSLIILGHICKRFSEGKEPHTALELKYLTGIPIRITTDLLYRLCAVNLINENSGWEKSEEPVYQPSRDTTDITVGRAVELLDSYPRKKLRNIDINEALLSADVMERVASCRRQYLESLSNIPVAKLVK